jgi:hypothetical protein
MARNSSNDGKNDRSCRRNLLQIFILRVIAVEYAITSFVALFLLLGKSEKVAVPHTPVLPTCIVEFRGTGFMATKSSAAVFARADNRDAGAEVVAVV